MIKKTVFCKLFPIAALFCVIIFLLSGCASILSQPESLAVVEIEIGKMELHEYIEKQQRFRKINCSFFTDEKKEFLKITYQGSALIQDVEITVKANTFVEGIKKAFTLIDKGKGIKIDRKRKISFINSFIHFYADNIEQKAYDIYFHIDVFTPDESRYQIVFSTSRFFLSSDKSISTHINGIYMPADKVKTLLEHLE